MAEILPNCEYIKLVNQKVEIDILYMKQLATLSFYEQ